MVSETLVIVAIVLASFGRARAASSGKEYAGERICWAVDYRGCARVWGMGRLFGWSQELAARCPAVG
jgi:hypothetical protein